MKKIFWDGRWCRLNDDGTAGEKCAPPTDEERAAQEVQRMCEHQHQADETGKDVWWRGEKFSPGGATMASQSRCACLVSSTSPRHTQEAGVVQATPNLASVSALLREYFSLDQFSSVASSGTYWMLLALAVGPLVMRSFGDTTTFVSGMFLYFALIWGVVLHRVIQPERGTLALAVIVWIGSWSISMLLLVAWISVPPDITGSAIESGNPFARLLGFVLGVGVREEIAKGLPVLAIIALRSKRGKPTTARQGLFLGAVAGLAFAAKENLHYFANFDYLDRVAQSYGVFSRGSVYVTLARSMLTPFLHATWAGIMGYFLASGQLDRARRQVYWVVGLSAAALIHGAYDFVSDDMLAFIVIAFSLYVFGRCAARAACTESVATHLDAALATAPSDVRAPP